MIKQFSFLFILRLSFLYLGKLSQGHTFSNIHLILVAQCGDPSEINCLFSVDPGVKLDVICHPRFCVLQLLQGQEMILSVGLDLNLGVVGNVSQLSSSDLACDGCSCRIWPFN
jgi:hypothetical protein